MESTLEINRNGNEFSRVSYMVRKDEIFIINTYELNSSEHHSLCSNNYIIEVVNDGRLLGLRVSPASIRLCCNKYIDMNFGTTNMNEHEIFRESLNIIEENSKYSLIFNNCQDFCSKLLFRITKKYIGSISLSIDIIFATEIYIHENIGNDDAHYLDNIKTYHRHDYIRHHEKCSS